MIAIHKTKVNNVQKIFKTEIDQQRLDAISKLTALDTTTTVREDKNYLKNIINLFTNNNDFLFWDS